MNTKLYDEDLWESANKFFYDKQDRQLEIIRCTYPDCHHGELLISEVVGYTRTYGYMYEGVDEYGTRTETCPRCKGNGFLPRQVVEALVEKTYLDCLFERHYGDAIESCKHLKEYLIAILFMYVIYICIPSYYILKAWFSFEDIAKGLSIIYGVLAALMIISYILNKIKIYFGRKRIYSNFSIQYAKDIERWGGQE